MSSRDFLAGVHDQIRQELGMGRAVPGITDPEMAYEDELVACWICLRESQRGYMLLVADIGWVCPATGGCVQAPGLQERVALAMVTWKLSDRGRHLAHARTVAA
jgi:hypothetical protein